MQFGERLVWWIFAPGPSFLVDFTDFDERLNTSEHNWFAGVFGQ